MGVVNRCSGDTIQTGECLWLCVYRTASVAKLSASKANAPCVNATHLSDHLPEERVVSTNIQHENVGNIGDIVKHAALLELGKLLRSLCGDETTINYLDTHAFQMYAPVADRQQWQGEVDELARKHGGYEHYRSFEMSELDQGRYACSTAVALEALSPKGQPVRLFLAEADSYTRSVLTDQLEQAGYAAELVAENMHSMAESIRRDSAGPVLALVDPFFETDDQYQAIWRAGMETLGRAHAPAEPGAILAYQWRFPGVEPSWPPAPDGWSGPLCEICEGNKHHLAVYLTDDACDVVRASGSYFETLSKDTSDS